MRDTARGKDCLSNGIFHEVSSFLLCGRRFESDHGAKDETNCGVNPFDDTIALRIVCSDGSRFDTSLCEARSYQA